MFEFGRRKTDTKVTLNATDKLILSGRLGWLNYDFFSPAMFGDLGGQPVHSVAAKAGKGLGDTYTITGSANYAVKSNVLIEAYTGITMIEVLSEPFRLDENLGREFLGIPGTNGRSAAHSRSSAQLPGVICRRTPVWRRQAVPQRPRRALGNRRWLASHWVAQPVFG